MVSFPKEGRLVRGGGKEGRFARKRGEMLLIHIVGETRLLEGGDDIEPGPRIIPAFLALLFLLHLQLAHAETAIPMAVQTGSVRFSSEINDVVVTKGEAALATEIAGRLG